MEPTETATEIVRHQGSELAPTQDPPDNVLLARYRGHRTRTWGDAEALHAIELKGQGYTTSEALDMAGIPRSAIWSANAPPSGMLLREAITDVHSREGADWWVSKLRQVVVGDLDSRATSAIIHGARDHGRLQPRSEGNVTINVGQMLVQLDAHRRTPPTE